MAHRPIPAREDIEALAGHRFPGGSYRIEHWENVLLTECTGASLLGEGLAHPSFLFHLAIAGSGTSIAELFALGQAESDYSIMIESYDWEFFSPLHEEIDYQVSGGVASAERCEAESARPYDRLQFCFEVCSPDQELVACSAITWHFTRNTL